MRIIAGKHKSRIFKSPPGFHTHPMSEKARGAIFNILGDVEGLDVLDAFAGSGALAFEAISRGARLAVVLDNDKRAYETLLENIESLKLDEEVHATMANSASWVKNNHDLSFDIVFADPPYTDFNPKHVYDVAEAVKPGGLLVLSHPKEFKSQLKSPTWELLNTRDHAAASITIFKRR